MVLTYETRKRSVRKTLLSPKELALAIGVSESTLKRWADEGLVQVSRTAGGHRRIPMPEALRFVRESKATIVRPDILQLHELAAVQQEVTSGRSTDEAVFAALKEGQAHRVRGLILGAYVAGRSLAAVFDGPLRDSLHRLGDLWHHDEQGILIEHRATDLCIQAINQLRSLLNPAADNAPLALGGACSNDPYILPSLMAATVLAEAGWRDMNFGPDTPVEVLMRAAERYQPRLVWRSCSVETDRDALGADMEHLADFLATRHIVLVVGGRGMVSPERLGRANTHRASSMAELAETARRLYFAA